MGKSSDLSPCKIEQIKVLLSVSAITQKDIAKKLNISCQSVSNIKKKMDKGLNLDSSRTGRCGRKRKTTPRTDRKIKQLAFHDKRKSCNSIASELQADNIGVSRITVNRRLLESGLQSYRPRKKPRLMNAMIKALQDWADAHANWTSEKWEKGGKPSINLGNGKRKKRKRNDSEESLNLQEDESSLQRIKIEENLDKEIVGMDSTTGMKVFCDAFPSNPIQTPGDDKDYDNENERTIPHHSQSQENSSGHDFSHSSSHFIGNNDEFMHSHEYETEFDVFGKSVAKKLNSMPRNDALRLQQKMEEVMTNFEVQTLSTPDNSSVDVKMELTDDFIE